MVILSWCDWYIHRFIDFSTRFISPNMTLQKGKGYQVIRATNAFECENTSDFKYYYWEKWKTYVGLQGYQGTKGHFSDKATLDIDVFTYEPVVQCVVQGVQSIFIEDSK